MRKFVLALAGAAALLTGVLTNPSLATTLANPAGMRVAITEVGGVEQVRLVCTHFWNGRWHRREICSWVGGHQRRHWHHYGSYGRWQHHRHRRHHHHFRRHGL